MFQRIVDTQFDRYPDVFRTLQARVAEKHGPGLGGGGLRILSFGCSAGLEMQSIRCYFPDAALFGCDLDVEVVSRARRALRKDRNARLFLSTPENIAAFGPYDIVMALSVLCRYPLSRSASDLNAILPYSLFEDLTGDIDRALAPRGLVAVVNSNYLFTSLPFADRYRPVRTPLIGSNGFVDRFAADGHRLTIDRRRGPLRGQEIVDLSGAIREDDLRDAIFERRAGNDPPTPIEIAVGEAVDESAMRPWTAEGAVDVPWPGAPPGLIYPRLDARLYTSPDGAPWVRREWVLARADRSGRGLGGWWTRATREEAKGLGSDQMRILADVRRATSRGAVWKAWLVRSLKMPLERGGTSGRGAKQKP